MIPPSHPYRVSCMRSFVLALVITLPLGVVPAQASRGSADLARALEDAWAHRLASSPSLRLEHGQRADRLPELSHRAWLDEAAFWRGIHARVSHIPETGLAVEERLSLRTLRWESRMLAGKAPFYWVDFSSITPYATPLQEVQRALGSFPIRSADDAEAYLALLRQVAPFADSLRAGLEARAARGNYLAADELPQSEALVRSFIADPAAGPFAVAEGRLAALDAGARAAFASQVQREVADRITPAFERLATYLAGDYTTHAPHRVGLGQYPDGLAYHRWLVRWHTTMDITPEAVHRIGLREVARINEAMAAIRREVGFTGTKAEFHAALRKDPRFFAKTPDEFGDRLMASARRIEPRLGDYFGRFPRARGDVRRLAPQLEPAMTFGYYQVPTVADSMGHYLYNGSSLGERSLLFGGALIAHELWPGHHFQINLASENTALPAVRREAYYTAFGEGWGDYAASVAGEMGMYQDPWDRYGRLSMSMFIACRLVVDTGMNALGWSRERAMQFMRDNALESETQVRSETLRYSVDMPGQALAYLMGSLEFQAQRQRAGRALGSRFDIRAFHDMLLGSGMLPMTVLADRVGWWIADQR